MVLASLSPLRARYGWRALAGATAAIVGATCTSTVLGGADEDGRGGTGDDDDDGGRDDDDGDLAGGIVVFAIGWFLLSLLQVQRKSKVVVVVVVVVVVFCAVARTAVLQPLSPRAIAPPSRGGCVRRAVGRAETRSPPPKAAQARTPRHPLR